MLRVLSRRTEDPKTNNLDGNTRRPFLIRERITSGYKSICGASSGRTKIWDLCQSLLAAAVLTDVFKVKIDQSARITGQGVARERGPCHTLPPQSDSKLLRAEQHPRHVTRQFLDINTFFEECITDLFFNAGGARDARKIFFIILYPWKCFSNFLLHLH